MKYRNLFVSFLILLSLAVFAFRSWLHLSSIISAGDWQYLYPDNLQGFYSITPQLWQQTSQNGLGGSFVYSLNFYPFLFVSSLIWRLFHIDWRISSKLLWFFPAVIFSILSSYYLSWVLFRNRIISFFSSIVYLFNTPFLIWVGGGQPTIATSYGLIPFSLVFLIQALHTKKIQYIIFLGLSLFLTGLYDLRILGLAFSVIVFYSIYYEVLIQKRLLFMDAVRSLFSFFLFAFLSSFWIMPLFFAQKPSFTAIAGDLNAQFLSWATFPHALSILHPFWPDNIFGKVSFFDQTFLFIPILAFASTLYITKNKKSNMDVLFFIFLSLLGAFLVKGTQPPFGQLYTFFYTYIPGFEIYRDSTKFYSLILLGFTILIPYATFSLFESLLNLFQKKIGLLRFTPYLFLFLIASYLLFLVKPLFTSSLTGTFHPRQIPFSYRILAGLLAKDHHQSRVLWLPEWNRFGYYTNTHPAISANELFLKDTCQRTLVCRLVPQSKDFFSYVDSDTFYPLLLRLHIRYLIVPIDTDQSMEAFLTERKEDPIKREKLIKRLDGLGFLQKQMINDIAVYSVKGTFSGGWDINSSLVRQAQNDEKYVILGSIISFMSFTGVIIYFFLNRKSL